MTVLNSAKRIFAGGAAVAATFGAAAALGASPAAASGSFVGQNITGSGSSLQGVAQGLLASGYLSWSGGQLTSQPSIAYTSTSSGQGLAEFGDAGETITICGTSHTFNAGTLNPGASGQSIANCESPNVFDGFVGTDDAPTASLITSGETAANHGTTASVKQLTLPILQAPVSVDFALPELVSLKSTDNLDLENIVLDNLWSNKIAATTDSQAYPANTWGAFLEAAGFSPITSGTPTATQFLDTGSPTAHTGGYTPITLAARSSGSGTTFTFRSYLNEVEQQRFGSTFSSYVYNDGDVSDTNAEATSTTGGWPVTVTETTGTSAGGGLVNYVHSNPGTVGYANLADAISTTNGPFTNEPVTVGSGSTAYQVLYAEVQDNGISTSSVQYADPSAENGTTLQNSKGNVYTGGNIYTGVAQAPGSGGPGSGAGFWTVPTTSDGSWAGLPVWGQDPYNTANGEVPQQGEVAAANDPSVYSDVSGANTTTYYPIVAATYDLIWSAYDGSSNVETTLAGERGVVPFEVGNTVKDYFTYVLGTGTSQGQVTIVTQGYAPLPPVIANDAASNQLSALSYATS